MSQHACKNEWCQKLFEVTDDDLAYLEKISPVFNGKKESIPPSSYCPECRSQRRLAMSNEINLFKSVCASSGKSIVSDMHASSPFKVYAQPLWFSDDWDAREYGRDFDFSKSFFEQFRELQFAVPYPCLYTAYEFDENSEYTNYAGKDKNCYLVFDSDENRDCYYSYSINSCVDSMDNFRVRRSELCYGCVDSIDCYNCKFVQDSSNCSDSMFLQQCISCKNCLFCCNLQNKEYCIENRQVTPEEFEVALQKLQSRAEIEQAKEHFQKFVLQHPKRAMHGINNEDVSGDYLTNCKNAYECFDGVDLWDCKRAYRTFMPLKDSRDCEGTGDSELLYECAEMGYGSMSCGFCTSCLNQLHDVWYCMFCEYAKHCFGCVGVRRKEYCILNKQYTKEEYEELVPKIIEHMKKTGEWGEFFPIQCSVFPYNDSLAQLTFPLTKEEAVSKGYWWRDADPTEYVPATGSAPETIDQVTDDLCKKTLSCSKCTKNFRVIPQELALMRKWKLPLSTQCFLCRHLDRMHARNPRTLFERQCKKCEAPIQTTYAPDRPEIVYCEKCYLEAVY